MKRIKLLIAAFLIPLTSFASDLDVLVARTALALGDEYAKLATSYQEQVYQGLGHLPTTVTADGDDIPQEFKSALDSYNNYLSLALGEYTAVFCETECPAPLSATGLQLPDTYNFLRREAYMKFSQLSQGSNIYGTIGKYSTIYAVNSNFEEHLLS